MGFLLRIFSYMKHDQNPIVISYKNSIDELDELRLAYLKNPEMRDDLLQTIYNLTNNIINVKDAIFESANIDLWKTLDTLY